MASSSQPEPSASSTNCYKNDLTLCTTYIHSMHQPRASAYQESQKNPWRHSCHARTSCYTEFFIFRTFLAWNTLPRHTQPLTSTHLFKLAIREHFEAQKFNCLHNVPLATPTRTSVCTSRLYSSPQATPTQFLFGRQKEDAVLFQYCGNTDFSLFDDCQLNFSLRKPTLSCAIGSKILNLESSSLLSSQMD